MRARVAADGTDPDSGLVMTHHRARETAEHQRLLLMDLVPLLDGYGITVEVHQPDKPLEPWLALRYGKVTTHVYVHGGWYCAFLGMRQARPDDPDGAARRIAWLCGVPGVLANGAHAPRR